MVMIVRVVAVWGHLTVDTPTCHNCHYCRLQLHTLHRCWTCPYTYCTYCTIVQKVWPRVLVCCLWLSGLSLATTPGTHFWGGTERSYGGSKSRGDNQSKWNVYWLFWLACLHTPVEVARCVGRTQHILWPERDQACLQVTGSWGVESQKLCVVVTNTRLVTNMWLTWSHCGVYPDHPGCRLQKPWNNGKKVPRLDLTSSTTPGQQIHYGRPCPDSKYDTSPCDWLPCCHVAVLHCHWSAAPLFDNIS